MKIAIDISPLETGHKVRGVGFYLEHLKRALLTYFPEHQYHFFTNKKEIPNDVDLVHYPYFDPFFGNLPLIKKHKTVVTVHDLTPLVFPEHFPAGIKGSLRWQLQRLVLKQVDEIIADSLASQKDIVRLVDIKKQKVSVVYLAGADEFKKMKKGSWEEDIQRKYHLPEKFVLYVGDVTWNKNLPRLLHAIKEANVPLVLVGKALAQKRYEATNPWNKDLVLINKFMKDDNRFIRLGFVPTEDLVMLYNMAHVFIMPSLYEGFGLPVIEAMQSGAPVITTKCGSLSEVAGDAAYYVDSQDLQSMSNGIKKVFFDSDLQKKLSLKGLEQARKFTWQKTAEKTIGVYSKILNS